MSEVNLKTITNRREKDRKRRTAMKAKLRAGGASEELIERIIDQQRQADLLARVGEEHARKITDAQDRELDDSGYQPTLGDPLLRGAARVQGITAKVVRRRNTITEFEYDHHERI